VPPPGPLGAAAGHTGKYGIQMASSGIPAGCHLDAIGGPQVAYARDRRGWGPPPPGRRRREPPEHKTQTFFVRFIKIKN